MEVILLERIEKLGNMKKPFVLQKQTSLALKPSVNILSNAMLKTAKKRLQMDKSSTALPLPLFVRLATQATFTGLSRLAILLSISKTKALSAI